MPASCSLDTLWRSRPWSLSRSSAVVHTRLDREAPGLGRPSPSMSLVAIGGLGSEGLWTLEATDNLELLPSISTPTDFAFISRNLFSQFRHFNIKVRNKALWISWLLRALRKSSHGSFWAFWKIIYLLMVPRVSLPPTEPEALFILFQLSYPVISTRCVLFKHGNKIGRRNKEFNELRHGYISMRAFK